MRVRSNDASAESTISPFHRKMKPVRCSYGKENHEQHEEILERGSSRVLKEDFMGGPCVEPTTIFVGCCEMNFLSHSYTSSYRNSPFLCLILGDNNLQRFNNLRLEQSKFNSVSSEAKHQ